MKDFSGGEALRAGWEVFKAKGWLLIAILVFTFLLNIIPSIAADMFAKDFWYISAVINIIAWVLGFIVAIGLIRIAITLVDNQEARFSDIFSEYRLFWKYLGASILVGFITLAGFILLIIPGIIWAVRLQFVPYLVIDKNLGPMAAIKESWRMTSGLVWRLFTFDLLLGFVNIFGLLLFGIGILVAAPVTMVAMAYVYRKLA